MPQEPTPTLDALLEHLAYIAQHDMDDLGEEALARLRALVETAREVVKTFDAVRSPYAEPAHLEAIEKLEQALR